MADVREFLLASDHRRAQAGNAAHAPFLLERRERFKDFDRLDPVLDANRAEFVIFKKWFGRFVDCAAHENRSGFRRALQTRRDVNRVAERRVFHSKIGSDISDDDQSRIQSNANFECDAEAWL